MTDAVSGRWVLLLDALLGAQTLGEAQAAASDLIDEAVPGGAATAMGAADLVRLVRSTAELRGNPYRAYVLGVLLVMATWNATWRRAAAPANSRVSPSAVASEKATEVELVAACADLMALASDEDPEVRALVYLLVGTVDLPVMDAVRRLEGFVDQEENVLARACALQAFVKAAMRLSEVDRREVAAGLSERVGAGSDLERARVRVELESVAYLPEEKVQLIELIELIGLGLVEHLEEPQFWPAESV